MSDLSPESRFRFLPSIPGKTPEKCPKIGIDFFGALLASKHYMLFSLQVDPREVHSLEGDVAEGERQRLGMQLDAFLEKAMGRRPSSKTQRKANLDDEVVRQRLRGLGYIE